MLKACGGHELNGIWSSYMYTFQKAPRTVLSEYIPCFDLWWGVLNIRNGCSTEI